MERHDENFDRFRIVKLSNRQIVILLSSGCFSSGFGLLHPFLGDAGCFATTLALVEQLSPANPAYLVYFYAIHVGRIQRENPFHAYAVGYFAHREHLGSTCAANLNHIAAKLLDTLLVAFRNFIRYGNVIARPEFGMFTYPE